MMIIRIVFAEVQFQKECDVQKKNTSKNTEELEEPSAEEMTHCK